MYFSLQVELSNMYRLMEEFKMATTEEALQAVRTSNLDVFFWDSPRPECHVEFEAAHDYNLVISGETSARSCYGLGLQKLSSWSERVTFQVLDMHESGFMESLEAAWILSSERTCTNSSDDGLQFQNSLGMEAMKTAKAMETTNSTEMPSTRYRWPAQPQPIAANSAWWSAWQQPGSPRADCGDGGAERVDQHDQAEPELQARSVTLRPRRR
ncbi:Glutamate [NMDA] receptor subunit 1 [Halotydeus destructor]|nr:Glutamate [NMDA] receptor subunit 1 [Halotydeus destructor]